MFDFFLDLLLDLLDGIGDIILDRREYNRGYSDGLNNLEHQYKKNRRIKKYDKRAKTLYKTKNEIKDDLLKYQKAYSADLIRTGEYKRICKRLNKQLKTLEKNGYDDEYLINMRQKINFQLKSKNYFHDPYLNGSERHNGEGPDWDSINKSKDLDDFTNVFNNNHRLY